MKKKTLVVFGILLLTIIQSCRISKDGAVENKTGGTENLEFPPERLFNKSELEIGRRVCNALRQKREYIQSHYDRQDKFRFQGTIVNCDGTKTVDSTFDAFLIGSTLQYLDSAPVPREDYFSDIVTDLSPNLKDICTSLQVSDNVSNTSKYGLAKYTARFVTDSYDRFELKKDISDSKGVFTNSGVESVAIITKPTQAPAKFIGIEKERSRSIRCSNKSYQSKKQVWLQAITEY